MPFNIDQALGIHAQALQLRAQRAEVLAANLANADTPNYKAKDIDFSAALKQAQGHDTGMKRTHSAHLDVGVDSGMLRTVQRRATQPTLDGNTVDTQLEQAAFAKNAVQYQASYTFLSGNIRAMLSAIRGE